MCSTTRGPSACFNPLPKIECDAPKHHDPAPLGTGSLLQAGEGGRTLDIHVGNVTLYH
jgi:hypothetical protein